jgi:hypothetical protein
MPIGFHEFMDIPFVLAIAYKKMDLIFGSSP